MLPTHAIGSGEGLLENQGLLGEARACLSQGLPDQARTGWLQSRPVGSRPNQLVKAKSPAKTQVLVVFNGRYWIRTSDPFRVKEVRYRCANRPHRATLKHHRSAPAPPAGFASAALRLPSHLQAAAP